MNEVTGLTDRELDEAIARQLGWVFEWHAEKRPNQCGALHEQPCWHNELGNPRGVPEWATSIDALQAVEGRLIAAGLCVEIYYDSGEREWSVIWHNERTRQYPHDTTKATTESRARAEAALLALRAIEPTSITTLASRENDLA